MASKMTQELCKATVFAFIFFYATCASAVQWAAARNEEPQSSCFKHVNSEQSKHGKCGGMPHDATCHMLKCPQGGTHCNAEPMKTSKPNEAEA